MNTLFVSIVLASALLAGQTAAVPTFQTSYAQAQQQSAAQKKPLAVIFGSGSNGWAKVVRDAAPSEEVNKVLAERYICVYVDTKSAAGKKLAQDFAIQNGLGIVLGDRTGAMQAFWHQGDLTNNSLQSYLQKYSNPQVAVLTTETVSTTRTSFYPPTEASSGATTIDWGTVGGSSYCPSCNNVRSRR
jgi:hypothetical protein